MDPMDRMLHSLPKADASPDLATRIQLVIHRRQRRRQLARWSSALLAGGLGLWLAWPALFWLSSGELYVSGAPWLLGGLDYFNSESLDMINRFFNSTLSAQTAVGSAFALSTWLGALLLCCAIFLVIDFRIWQPRGGAHARGGSSAMLSSSVHT